MKRSILIIFLICLISAAENRYEQTIQNFEKEDVINFPPKNSILFVGSSSIRLWKSLAKDFPEAPTINRGFGGSETSDVLHFTNRIVISYKPKAIVFYCGENDISAGKSADTAVKDFETFHKRVHEKLPNTPIFYVSMKPSPLRWHLWPKMAQANKLIKQLCTKKNNYLHFIDIASPMIVDGKPSKNIFIKDMLHMNEKGYVIWAKVIKNSLRSNGVISKKE